MNTNVENYLEKFPLSSDLISYFDQSNRVMDNFSKVLSELFQKGTQERFPESEKITECLPELEESMEGYSLMFLFSSNLISYFDWSNRFVNNLSKILPRKGKKVMEYSTGLEESTQSRSFIGPYITLEKDTALLSLLAFSIIITEVFKLKGVFTPFEVEEKAFLEIVNRFSRIKEVKSITCSIIRTKYVFMFFFLSINITKN